MSATDRRPAFAAVDWGTSSFRLWLMNAGGEVLGERRSHEGMAIASQACGFQRILKSHLAELGAAEDLPVIICGMAGARQGWTEAGYVTVPPCRTPSCAAPCGCPAKAATCASFPALPIATPPIRT